MSATHGLLSPAATPRVLPLSSLGGGEMPSHLVAYTPPPVTVASQPVSDTVTEHALVGQATWYPEAPPGKCASHFLPKGTLVTVTNLANHASTTCVVDDYEAAPYPRVLDMSPSGFAQLEVPSRGVVDVRISW